MKCQNNLLRCCSGDATERVWCPTWVTAENGPINFCAVCARGFKPEFNKHSKNGEFHWGADADKAYADRANNPLKPFKFSC